VKLVYLYGPPASGKLTVAERLAELTGFPLFDNHLTVNVLRTIFPFGSSPFIDAVHRVRRDVFEVAADAGVSLIYTNSSAWAGPDGRTRFAAFAESVRALAEERGGQVLFVRLTASQAALEERLANESRQAREKLVDTERLRELLADLDLSSLHPDDLVIDTEKIGPDEAARLIAELAARVTVRGQ
jgi:chloramphenicol 3-O-phosphotransferase